MKYEDIKFFSERCEEHPDHQTGMVSHQMIQDRLSEEVDELRAYIESQLAQPEQEPVAWMNDSTPSGIFARHIDGARNFGCTIPLYTTPPQRRWVGLTDEEIIAINMSTVTKLIDEPIVCDTDHNIIQLGKAIEAKLKQKNGYSEEKNI